MGKKLGSALIVFIWVGLDIGTAFCRPPAGSPPLRLQEVQLSKVGKQRTLTLRFAQPPDFVHAFVLPSPARLVIDVGGKVERSASATYAASDALIRRVRVGSHPNHTRFVLDLKANQLPPFSVEQQAKLVTAVLNEQAEQADASQEGSTQVLFARTTKTVTSSQNVPPTPARAPSSLTPIVLTKKSVSLPDTPPRATPPSASASIVTPEEEIPLQTTPPESSSNAIIAAVPERVPLTAVPVPPPLAPAVSSQDKPPSQTLSSTVSQHLRRGHTLYNEGNLDGAIRQWRKAVHLAPTNAEAHYRIGLALQDRGDLTQAIAAFGESLRLNPDNATVHIHLARALEVKGDTHEALAAYNNALQLAPTSAHVHNRLGHLLVAEGDIQGAVKAWQQTIYLQPDYAYAYVSLGEALEQMGQTGEALAAYKHALLLDSRAPFASAVHQRLRQLRATDLQEENSPYRFTLLNENGAGRPENSGRTKYDQPYDSVPK